MAEATVSHGKSPACSCLVHAIFDGVPAGPSRAPTKSCRCRQGLRAVAAGWAAPRATAARAPALPGRARRQEAAESVSLHGAGRPESRRRAARCGSALPGCVRSIMFGLSRLCSTQLARLRSALPVCSLGSSRPRLICLFGSARPLSAVSAQFCSGPPSVRVDCAPR